MKSSIRCLSKATCFSLALILLSTPLLHAGAITSVAAFSGEAIIPFSGDGYLENGGGLYPGDSYVAPPAVNKGFESPYGTFGPLLSVAANNLGGLFNYYDWNSDQSDLVPNDGSTQNPEVIFRDVSLNPTSGHTDLSLFQAPNSVFDNFLNTGSHPASWGEALVLTDSDNTAKKLQLDFVAPVERIGMFFNGAAAGTTFFTMDVFGVGPTFALLGSTTVGDYTTGPGDAGFIGWEDLLIPIGRVVLRESNFDGSLPANSTSSALFDDIRYELATVIPPDPGPTEIPEPSTLLLASFGLLGLAARCRRTSR